MCFREPQSIWESCDDLLLLCLCWKQWTSTAMSASARNWVILVSLFENTGETALWPPAPVLVFKTTCRPYMTASARAFVLGLYSKKSPCGHAYACLLLSCCSKVYICASVTASARILVARFFTWKYVHQDGMILCFWAGVQNEMMLARMTASARPFFFLIFTQKYVGEGIILLCFWASIQIRTSVPLRLRVRGPSYSVMSLCSRASFQKLLSIPRWLRVREPSSFWFWLKSIPSAHYDRLLLSWCPNVYICAAMAASKGVLILQSLLKG
jgi:hypothetical protein